jgi:hypothetical protein
MDLRRLMGSDPFPYLRLLSPLRLFPPAYFDLIVSYYQYLPDTIIGIQHRPALNTAPADQIQDFRQIHIKPLSNPVADVRILVLSIPQK